LKEKVLRRKNYFLAAGNKNFGLELMLAPEKNPTIHGQNGISQKAKGWGMLPITIPSLA